MRSHGRTRVPFEVPLAATDQAVISAIEHDLLRLEVLEASLAKALEALQEPAIRHSAQRRSAMSIPLEAEVARLAAANHRPLGAHEAIRLTPPPPPLPQPRDQPDDHQHSDDTDDEAEEAARRAAEERAEDTRRPGARSELPRLASDEESVDDHDPREDQAVVVGIEGHRVLSSINAASSAPMPGIIARRASKARSFHSRNPLASVIRHGDHDATTDEPRGGSAHDEQGQDGGQATAEGRAGVPRMDQPRSRQKGAFITKQAEKLKA